MVESRSMGQRPVAGSGPSGPGPCQQLLAHPVQLAHVAPPEAAQEGAQGGWRLDHAIENTGRPTGAQRTGVVDAVAASQRRRDQGHHLVPRVGPPRRVAQVEVMVNEFPQAQVLGQGGRRGRPALATSRWSSKETRMPSGWLPGGIYRVLLFRDCFAVTKQLSQIQRSTL